MTRGPLLHGILLCIALGIGYQTWTREKVEDPKTGDIEIWTKDANLFDSLVFQRNGTSDSRIVKVERRKGEEDRPYLWGEVTRSRTTKKKTPPKESSDGEISTPEEKETTKATIKEFPIGEAGDELVEKIARLRALSKVDNPTEEQLKTYGLADPKSTLSISFSNQAPSEFALGNKVFGGADLYALDAKSNTVYVLSTKVVGKLNGAENSLQLRKFHDYKEEDIGSVKVTTKAGEKVMVKGETKVEKGTKTTWAYKSTPNAPDPTLGNFLSRFKRLRPSGYAPELKGEELTQVGRLEFRSTAGGKLGFVELAFKMENGSSVYFMKTEKTRVYGSADRLTAEQIHQDMTEFFGGPAVPESAAPAKPARSNTPSKPGGHGHGHGH